MLGGKSGSVFQAAPIDVTTNRDMRLVAGRRLGGAGTLVPNNTNTSKLLESDSHGMSSTTEQSSYVPMPGRKEGVFNLRKEGRKEGHQGRNKGRKGKNNK
jgi:hypothetical protein